MHVKSLETTELTVSLMSSDGLQMLASAAIRLASSLKFEHHDEYIWLLPIGEGLHCCRVSGTSNWIKLDQSLVAKGTDRTSRLQITANKRGVVWLDQVSLMPSDTYKVNLYFCCQSWNWEEYISRERLDYYLVKHRNLKGEFESL